MTVQYPSHLYIRVDRPLRAELHQAAVRNGVGVSALSRKLLRQALDGRSEGRDCLVGGTPRTDGE